jgi:hypothetical protein
MQFNICWTANRADREVMRKTENETNNISGLKSDKNISCCILAYTQGHQNTIMEIQSYIKSTLLRHDTTVVCTQIHYLWRLKTALLKPTFDTKKIINTSAIRNIGLIIKNIFMIKYCRKNTCLCHNICVPVG